MPATSPSSNPMGLRSGMWPLRRASTNWRSSGSSGGASRCGSIPLQRTDCFQLDGDAALRLSFLFWVLVRQQEPLWRREGSGFWPSLARALLEAPGKRRVEALVDPFRKRRSEEHTSELQSRPHLVCRLLLEKKKKKHRRETNCMCHTA